jgi:hypothetical protein
MTDLVVRPVRFTDNIEPMRLFLEALGLRPRVESTRGGWVEMVADDGMVALHSARDSQSQAPSGFTSLSFDADDVDALAKRLRDADVPDVVVYDEAYGRVLDCLDPLGHHLQIDEHSDDLYGYRVHQPEGVASGLRVMPLRLAHPIAGYAEFLGLLGCVPRGEVTEDFAAFTLGVDGAGLVGVHPPMDPATTGASAEVLTRPGASYLSFETTEDLAVVAERLERAGFPTSIAPQECVGDVLAVRDADGLRLEVHTSPSSRQVLGVEPSESQG